MEVGVALAACNSEAGNWDVVRYTLIAQPAAAHAALGLVTVAVTETIVVVEARVVVDLRFLVPVLGRC